MRQGKQKNGNVIMNFPRRKAEKSPNTVSSQFLLLTSGLSPDFSHPLLRFTLPSLTVLQGPPFGAQPSTKTFLTALSLFPELQAFAHHGRPLPRYQVALCFGEEFPDPQRQRKLITAHVSRTWLLNETYSLRISICQSDICLAQDVKEVAIS